MSTTPVAQKDELARIVAEGQQSGRRRWLRRAGIVTVIIAAVVTGLVMTRLGNSAAAPVYQTQEAATGELVVTVSATGNLQPTNAVEVGSEVSGLVDTVFVDDNSHVKKGQVLARLDTSKLQDQVINARAALASAEARVLQASASVKEADANLSRLRQVSELSGGKVPSKSEMETAEATAARARADEASTKASVEQSRASLNSAETNLAKASIRSPIDGVVLTREIEPGQTVAASFQAPVLFTLAEDLSEMELQVDVDEADVGNVREGQAATFTVDAYTGRKYPARITRVGYGSQTKDNVVSYKTLLTVDNDDLTLRPGMTASAEITIVRRTDALLVPNAALRYTPPVVATPAQSGSLVSSLLPRPPGPPAKTKPAKDAAQKVWVLRNGQPEAVPVTVGATDGRMTEITGGDLKAGMLVITESSGGL